MLAINVGERSNFIGNVLESYYVASPTSAGKMLAFHFGKFVIGEERYVYTSFAFHIIFIGDECFLANSDN